jgi:hypothetical protein
LLLAELYSASIAGRVATGSRAGKRIVRIGDEIDFEGAAIVSGSCCASIEGFSIYAGVCVPARDRVRLERLLRYGLRPPLWWKDASFIRNKFAIGDSENSGLYGTPYERRFIINLGISIVILKAAYSAAL